MAAEQKLPEYPNIEDFRETDNKGLPKPLKEGAMKRFASLLLNYHTQHFLEDTGLHVMNSSLSKEDSVELCLYHGSEPDNVVPPDEKREQHWCLDQFSCETDSVLADIVDRWYQDCCRYPELNVYTQILQNRTQAHKVVKEFILTHRAKNIRVLSKYDDTNAHGRFQLGGRTFEVFRSTAPEDKGKWVFYEGLNNKEDLLLTDTADIADDAEYEKNLPDYLNFVRTLVPDYEAEGDENSMNGNHAIDIIHEQLAKPCLPVKMREAVFCTGIGNNGKSTLAECLSEIVFRHPHNSFLSYAMTMPGITFADLKDGGSAENKQKGLRAKMQHARLVFSTEMPNTALDGDFLKPLTVGEQCIVGGNYKDDQPMTYHCVVFICTNNPPRFYEDTDGIDRRCIVIRFNQNFKKNAHLAITPDEIRAKFLKWRPTILRHHLETIRYMVEVQQLKPRKALPGLMEEDRKAIMDRGRDPVQVALERFFTTGTPEEGKQVLLGGGSEVHGYSVGKGKFYGVGLVVRLLCNKIGTRIDHYKAKRVENMLHRIGGEQYAGNRAAYKNLVPTKELLDFMQGETSSHQAVHYLYDWDGEPSAAGNADEIGL